MLIKMLVLAIWITSIITYLKAIGSLDQFQFQQLAFIKANNKFFSWDYLVDVDHKENLNMHPIVISKKMRNYLWPLIEI